jgi:hypothetical protein
MGIRDVLDRLFGTPGWHREHVAAWEHTVHPLPSGLFPLQESLRTVTDLAIAQAGFASLQWSTIGTGTGVCLKATIPHLGVEVWLFNDTAGFNYADRRLTPNTTYEEWDFKTPADFEEAFSATLQTILARPPRE